MDDAVKRCPYCAEVILAAAVKCKHCKSDLTSAAEAVNDHREPASPQPARPRTSVLRAAGGILVVASIFIFVFRSCNAVAPTRDAAQTAIPAATVAPAPIETGPAQSEFCGIFFDFAKQYRAAKDRGANEAELSELRHSRRNALAAIVGQGVVHDWRGIMKHVSTNSGGTATIRVLLSCTEDKRDADAQVAKFGDNLLDHVAFLSNNEFTRVDSLYPRLVKIQEHTPITFSGTIVNGEYRGKLDIVDEISVTEFGSMTDPVILFDFKSFDSLKTVRGKSRASVDPSSTGVLDCAKARSPAEVMICNDSGLSKQDADVAGAYHSRLSASDADTDQIYQAQKEFLAKRNKCEDVDCLRETYLERSMELAARE